MSTFRKGDRVAWSHQFSTQHAPISVVYASAVPTLSEDHPDFGDPGTGQFGTIVGPGNDEGTYWEVQLDDGGKRVLTSDELVRVVEEDNPADVWSGDDDR